MTLVTNLNMKNGLAIIGRKQTAGVGRNKNQVCIRINNSFCSHFQFIRFFDAYKLKKYLQWLSPDGCALFSLQLHIPLSSPLGQKVPLIQHLVSVAIVNSIVKLDDYKVIGFWCLLNIYLHKHYKLNTDKTIFFNYVVPHFNQWQICRVNNNVKQIHFSLFLFFRKQKLDIRLKWPNDMYAYGNTKIGGLVVNTELNAGLAICNVGVGFNLNNSIPTTCVNDMIKAYNIKNNTKLPYLDYECFFANVFNEIEELLYVVQTHSDFDYLYDLYYKLWFTKKTKNIFNSLFRKAFRKCDSFIPFKISMYSSSSKTIFVFPLQHDFEASVICLTDNIYENCCFRIFFFLS